MQVKFTLPFKAFSLNAYRYGYTPHKTKAAREFEETVLRSLGEAFSAQELADKWNSGGYNQIQVDIVHVYPRAVFYNKAGAVSAKTFDLSNTEKILLDLIVNRYVGLDDRFVTRLVSSKEAGKSYSVEVTLTLSHC